MSINKQKRKDKTMNIDENKLSVKMTSLLYESLGGKYLWNDRKGNIDSSSDNELFLDCFDKVEKVIHESKQTTKG